MPHVYNYWKGDGPLKQYCIPISRNARILKDFAETGSKVSMVAETAPYTLGLHHNTLHIKNEKHNITQHNTIPHHTEFSLKGSKVSHWETYSAPGGWLLALPTHGRCAARSRVRNCGRVYFAQEANYQRFC